MLYRPPKKRPQSSKKKRAKVSVRLELQDAFEFLAE
jgi:hypothetical protein